jgi:hypothetical protein
LQVLIIKGRLAGLNEMIAEDRRSWKSGGELKKHQTAIVTWECLAQKIKKYKVPIDLEITFYEKDYKRDSDNITAAVKYIKDGIVKAGVIPNDTRKWVREKVNYIEVDKLNPRIEIIIKEKEEAKEVHGLFFEIWLPDDCQS